MPQDSGKKGSLITIVIYSLLRLGPNVFRSAETYSLPLQMCGTAGNNCQIIEYPDKQDSLISDSTIIPPQKPWIGVNDENS